MINDCLIINYAKWRSADSSDQIRTAVGNTKRHYLYYDIYIYIYIYKQTDIDEYIYIYVYIYISRQQGRDTVSTIYIYIYKQTDIDEYIYIYIYIYICIYIYISVGNREETLSLFTYMYKI